MTPEASQDAPKVVPRAPKTGSRDPKITPRDLTISPRGLFGRSWVALHQILNQKIGSRWISCLLFMYFCFSEPTFLIYLSMFLTVLQYLQKSLPKRFPSAVGPPKVLRHGSKMTPGASQDAPKRIPRAAKTSPRAAKIAPRDSKIGPRGHSGPSRAPKSSPRGLQKVIQQSQEPSKTSKRGVWTSILQLPNSFPGTCWFRSRCVHSESFSDTDVSTDNYMVAIKRAGKTSLEVPQRNHEGIATFRMLLLLVRTSPMARWRLRAQPTG